MRHLDGPARRLGEEADRQIEEVQATMEQAECALLHRTGFGRGGMTRNVSMPAALLRARAKI